MDEDYYISKGGKIPIKWTAPEVPKMSHLLIKIEFYRLSLFENTPQPVMYGVMEYWFLKYGAWERSHFLNKQINRSF